jgi:glutathione S-transferase
MTTGLILHYAPDNASLCVRLLLEDMGLPYETRLVDRSVNAQKSEAYLQINPNGLIPTLDTPDGPIFETGAILLWLADRAPGTVFPAPDDALRGAALRQLFWISNTLHPTLRMLFYPDQYIDTVAQDVRRKTQQRLCTYLDQLDDVGPMTSPVLASYVAPLLRWCALYGGDTSWFDLSHWPNLDAFAKTFEAQPKAHQACTAEGLGATPFSKPHLPNPSEGSAT